MMLLKSYLHFLAQQQTKKGCFEGQASWSIHHFQPHSTEPSIFLTALILRLLHNVPGSEDIQKKAANFLLEHRSSHWSWNYWQREALVNKLIPIPDDLDDTSCALIALTLYDSSLIDGTVLGQLAKLLIISEVSTSGPYKTWLVSQSHESWDDIDLAVNANIGYLLSLHKVTVTGINNMIDQAIDTDEISSPYYVGKFPIIFFISEWYKGKCLPKLTSLVSRELNEVAKHSGPLYLSQLIIGACRLGFKPNYIKPSIDKLLSLVAGDSWPAEAFYVETIGKDHTTYIGSASLTTAFALQALTSYERLIIEPEQPVMVSQPIITKGIYTQDVPEPLKSRYQRKVRQIIVNERHGQISDMAGITAKAYNLKIDPVVKQHLNQASLHGWLAYTIYDDFWDDEGNTIDLAVANLALRQTIYHFHEALPSNTKFSRLVDKTLNTVDNANHWEVKHSRTQIHGEKISFTKLPDYGAYNQLAEKSWGHMLAACGVLILSSKYSSSEIDNLQKFFHHYLITRQLNDDAHDWEEDLQAGRITAVIAKLLSDWPDLGTSLKLDQDLDDLRLLYWKITIVKVLKDIKHHLRLARQALQNCSMTDSSEFRSWLDRLEEATEQTAIKRRETEKFITSYQS